MLVIKVRCSLSWHRPTRTRSEVSVFVPPIWNYNIFFLKTSLKSTSTSSSLYSVSKIEMKTSCCRSTSNCETWIFKQRHASCSLLCTLHSGLSRLQMTQKPNAASVQMCHGVRAAWKQPWGLLPVAHYLFPPVHVHPVSSDLNSSHHMGKKLRKSAI